MRRSVAAALLVLALAAGCGGGGEIAALPAGSFVAARGSMSPTVHLFGDTIAAEVQVVVDRSQLDPGRLSLTTNFSPYEQVGETEVTRRDAGAVSELRYRLQLRCLERACMTAQLGTIVDPAGGAPRVFRFPPAQLLYTDPDAKEPRVLRLARFTPLESVSRINAQDVSQVYGFPFRGTFSPLPTLSQRVSPATLAGLLLLLAAALLVLPASLLLRWLHSRRQPPPPEPEPEPSQLERAIALVEWSLEHDDAERRAALDALATELDVLASDGLESDGLADESRVAAWSPRPPSPVETTRILTLVKERHGNA